MSQKQISQWRSVGFAFLVLLVLAAVLLVVALVAMAKAKDSPQIPVLLPVAAGMFGSLVAFASVAVVAAFGKSLGEKAADGPGFKGIARVLMTEAKPGEPPPPAEGAQP